MLVQTEQDYDTALLRIESLMMAEADTPEADELEVLATLVELYEDKHYPIAFGASGAIGWLGQSQNSDGSGWFIGAGSDSVFG